MHLWDSQLYVWDFEVPTILLTIKGLSRDQYHIFCCTLSLNLCQILWSCWKKKENVIIFADLNLTFNFQNRINSSDKMLKDTSTKKNISRVPLTLCQNWLQHNWYIFFLYKSLVIGQSCHCFAGELKVKIQILRLETTKHFWKSIRDRAVGRQCRNLRFFLAPRFPCVNL
jgi:hypothetical protein